MIISIFLGIFFGFSLYLAGANVNTNILNMLRLKNMKIGKIIFFAIGFASFLTGVFAIIGFLDLSHFSVKSMHLGVIIGAIIFGIGFGMIGRCPGTCPASITSGFFIKGIITFIGGLLGALIFSLTYSYFDNLGLFDILNYGKISIFHLSNKFPSVLNISHGGLIIMGVLFMLISYAMPEKIRR